MAKIPILRSNMHRSAVSTVRSSASTVVVTGAGGRTGKLVAQKLSQQNKFTDIRAVIRSNKGDLEKIGIKSYCVDVSAGRKEDYQEAFNGADAVIIATSAIPKLNIWSLPKVFWAKLTGGPAVMPDFNWKEGQRPEQVDWLGQKAQIDAAVDAKVKHIVLISSMGGTQDGQEGRTMNMLNKLGSGNILLWKRKAEQYLMASGMKYTIIHPGGLLDEAGGTRQVILGVDDQLLSRKVRSIPRADVAELCILSLLTPEAINRSFDAIAPPYEDASGQAPPLDWDLASLLKPLEGKNCDYTIASQM